jgi:hypothetical protein
MFLIVNLKHAIANPALDLENSIIHNTMGNK